MTKIISKWRKRKMAISIQREALLDEVMCDLLNGMSKFQVQRKLQEKLYDSQVKDKEPSPNSINGIIRDAYKRCQLELKENRDEQRALMYSRILSIYENAVEANDRTNALRALDQLTNLMGLDEPEKVDVNMNNFKLRVNVSFGVGTDGNEDDDEGTEGEDEEG